MDEATVKLSFRVGKVFRPSAPIDRYALFAGRVEQLKRIGSAIAQPGQHAIVYGERGVGKTSLTNVISELFSNPASESLRYARVNCDSGDTFENVWQKAFRQLYFVAEKRKPGFNTEAEVLSINVSHLLPSRGDISPDDIRYAFQRIGGQNIVVIDEIDRIQNSEITLLIADTIKSLSDNLTNATIILVGVADSIEELIADHQSIERALVQVEMPRMSHEELSEILDKALNDLKLTIDPRARDEIASLSQGLPHYTHSLGLYAAQNAVESHRKHITTDDVNTAIRKSVENIQQSIRSSYHKATVSSQKTIFVQLLLACALANLDEMGYFKAKDVREPMSKIMGKPYEITGFARILHDLCESGRGPVLHKSGVKRNLIYRFVNPLLQPYVIMKGITEGYITQDELQNVFLREKSRQGRLWKDN